MIIVNKFEEPQPDYRRLEVHDTQVTTGGRMGGTCIICETQQYVQVLIVAITPILINPNVWLGAFRVPPS